MKNIWFISIHGIDGTWKTSVCHELSEILNKQWTQTINYEEYIQGKKNIFSKIKSSVKSDYAASQEFLNFVNSQISHGKEIQSLLSQWYTVIKDRYIDDVWSHSSFRGVSCAQNIIDILEENKEIIIPDYKILLTVKENERMRRIHKRGNPTAQDLIPNTQWQRPYHYETFLKNRINTHHRWIVVDTSEKSIKQVVDEILWFIGQ